MGIMEKLSEMRRKKLDEDWRDDARAAKAAKGVEDFHRKRLEQLDFNIDTSFGDFQVKIRPAYGGGGIELRCYLGVDYLFYKLFINAKQLKSFIEEDLSEEIYKNVREKFGKELQKMPRDKAKKTVSRLNGLLDELDKEIDLKIDFDELDRKIHRFAVYSKALIARNDNKSALEYNARRHFEKEHGFEVGDVVYGTTTSDLRDGKAYVVDEIEKTGRDKQYWKYKLKPENGRGNGGTAYGYQIYLDSDVIDTAVNNPDDPKYDKKFDQQKYMMDRYSADRQFDEAVELLNGCGMVVESVATELDEKSILAKYSKYTDLDDIEFLVGQDTGSDPEVTFGRRNKIVWIETPEFDLVGTYRYDEETGKYLVKLQSVKF